MNKLIKLSEVRAAKQELNEKLGGNPYKLIYELLTNIPKPSMLVSWNWVLEKDGLHTLGILVCNNLVQLFRLYPLGPLLV